LGGSDWRLPDDRPALVLVGVSCIGAAELEELADELDELELLELLEDEPDVRRGARCGPSAVVGSNSRPACNAWMSAWMGEQALQSTCGWATVLPFDL